MKTFIFFVLLFGYSGLSAQELISNDYEKGQIKDGQRYSLWEYYDDQKELELKIDYKSGRVYYLKPDTAKFAIFRDSAWVMETLRVYPIPIEGYYNFYKKVRENMSYPKEALNISAEATIYLMFLINEKGEASEFTTMQDLPYGFEQEVNKLVSYINHFWIPAQSEGRRFQSRFILPLQYSIGQAKTFVAPHELPTARILKPIEIMGTPPVSINAVSRTREQKVLPGTLSSNNAIMDEGVIFMKSGDSLRCFVELQVDYGKRVRYKLTPDGKEMSVKVSEVKSMITPYNELENVLLDGKEILMAVVIDGSTKLLKHVSTVASAPQAGYGGTFRMYMEPIITYAFIKDTSVHEITKKNFQLVVPELVKDNYKIYDRLLIKPFQFDDIENVIYEYVNGKPRDESPSETIQSDARATQAEFDDAPSFDGGYEAMMNFIKNNMRYPASARRLGIDGTVYINFAILEDGTLTDIKVLRGISGDCDREAVRVVKLMPKWIPAKQNGKAVTTMFNLPIIFKLN